MKAVIDTNVFMAALINKRGAPAKIYHRWLDRQFDLVKVSAFLRELERAAS